MDFCRIKRLARFISLFLFVFSFLFNFTSFAADSDFLSSMRVPSEFGSIAETYLGDSDRLVFLIADNHSSFEVQSNIAGIVDFLSSFHDIKNFGVEASSGPISLDRLRSFYNEKAKEAVAYSYVKSGLLDGSVVSALRKSSDVRLFGIDDVELHRKQVDAFKSFYDRRLEVMQQLDHLKEMFSFYKDVLYPEELLQLEDVVREYNQSSATVFDYADIIQGLAAKYNILTDRFKNLGMSVKASKVEVKLNVEKAAEEENTIIERLRALKGISLEDLSILQMAENKRYVDSRHATQYYEFIRSLCSKYKISLNEYPDLWTRVRAESIRKKIDLIGLADELKVLLPLVKKEIVSNAASEHLITLVELDRRLNALKQFYSFSASLEVSEEVRENRMQFASAVFIDFIRSNAVRYDVSYRIDPRVVIIDKSLETAIDVYDLSSARSQVIYQNQMNMMENASIKHAALISGKYHIDEIETSLKDKGISYILILPRMSRLVEDIDYDKHLLDGGRNLVNFFSSAPAYNLRLWNRFSATPDYDDRSFRRLFSAELVAYDFFSRIHLDADSIDEEQVKKALAEVELNLKSYSMQSFGVLHGLVCFKDTKMIFLRLGIKIPGEMKYLLMQPLSERKDSYAETFLGQFSVLKGEDIHEGVFNGSDDIIKKLSKKHELLEIVVEKAAEPEVEPVTDTAEKSQELAEGAEKSDEQKIEERLRSIGELIGDIEKVNDLSELSIRNNRFTILKSQLLFFDLSKKEKQQINSAEVLISSRIAQRKRELREEAEKKRRHEEELRKANELALRLKQAQQAKERRDYIESVMSKVLSLQEKITGAGSLIELNSIEDLFNKAVSKLEITDLNRNDKIILNAFKVKWDTKYAEFKKMPKAEAGDDEVLRVTKTGVVNEVMTKARNLKELVELASLPEDGQMVLAEFDRMRTDLDESLFNPSELNFLDHIRSFIIGRVDGLESGEAYVDDSLMSQIRLADAKEKIRAETSPDVDEFAKIYDIRNRAMIARDMDELSLIKKDFNSFDNEMKNKELSNTQKALLADTERIIKGAIRTRIIKAGSRKSSTQTGFASSGGDNVFDLEDDISRKSTIALIESNVTERRILKQTLEKEGFFVREFDNFQLTYADYGKEDVNLILLDDDIIDKKTGTDFVIDIKRMEKKSGIEIPPIVLHTNNSISWTARMLKKQGFTRKERVYVVSKRDIEENIRTIKKIIKKWSDS